MERIPIRITALLVMTTLAACDFLDIDTPGIVNRDKMFENEQGFIDAMNGVYASMADADLYGEQLSFGFVDEIAQLYYNDYEANETTLTKTFDLRYRDEDVRPQIDAIWSKAYNTIASANSVLDNISGHDFAILPRIRGEALTVRAFLHFDLLRLFAPNIERGDEQAIPYVEHFSISPVERSTVREVYERIVADLTEAYGLLRDAQPASGRTPEELYVSQYAAAALLARVCNWGGDHETAERYALEALKGPFAFIREEQIKNLFLGYTARTECIWGLHAPDMYLDVRSRLYPTRLTDELDMVRDNYQTIFRVSSFTSTNNDYRYQSYFTRTKWEHSVVLLTKFYDKYYDEEQIVPSGRIPGAESGASARAVLHSGRIGLRPRSGRCARISEYRGDGTRPAPDRGGRHRHASELPRRASQRDHEGVLGRRSDFRHLQTFQPADGGRERQGAPRHRRHLPAAAPRKRGIGGHRLNRIQDETPYAKIPRSGGRAARSGGLRL